MREVVKPDIIFDATVITNEQAAKVDELLKQLAEFFTWWDKPVKGDAEDFICDAHDELEKVKTLCLELKEINELSNTHS